MFCEIKSREILRFKGKQNLLFPEGTGIKCLWCYSECASTAGKLKSLPDHGVN